MITAGIDIGSISTKAAVLSDGKLLGTRLIFTGYNAEAAGRTVFEELLKDLGLERQAVRRLISTGYGRNSVKFVDKAVTEITCHGAGAHYLDPGVRSIIDIGGQDSKVIVIDEKGKVKNFAMNDKCAAGTGRFLEVILGRLHVPLEGLEALVARAPRAVPVSSTCTVFAESEVISLVAGDEPLDGIVKGLHVALASRVAALARGAAAGDEVLMSGGVALNGAMVAALREALGRPVRVLPEPQLVGALGAALSVVPAAYLFA